MRDNILVEFMSNVGIIENSGLHLHSPRSMLGRRILENRVRLFEKNVIIDCSTSTFGDLDTLDGFSVHSTEAIFDQLEQYEPKPGQIMSSASKYRVEMTLSPSTPRPKPLAPSTASPTGFLTVLFTTSAAN